MNSKADILCYLFRNNILSPTPSRLAQDLMETDKKLCDGIWDNRHVGPKRIEDFWNKVMHVYNISEYTLSNLQDYWELSDQMAEVMTEDDFMNLCLRKLSCVKDYRIREKLRTIYNESWIDYDYVLALFYTKQAGYEVNKAKNSQLLIEVLRKVDMILHNKYPESEVAHLLVLEYISKVERAKFLGWTLLMVLVGNVICYYTHPLYINQMRLEQFPPVSLPEYTWWKEPSATESQATLWRLTRLSEFCGLYDVIVMNAQRGHTITPEDCSVYRIGFQSQYQSLQFCKTISAKKYVVSFYGFRFNDDYTQLELGLQKNLSGNHPLSMPQVLTRIEPKMLWKYGIREKDLDEINRIEMDMNLVNQGIENTDMEVLDVTMTRTSCILHVRKSGNEIKDVKFPIDEDSLFENIDVWDEVKIIRGKADGELYAEWEGPNIRVHIPNGVL